MKAPQAGSADARSLRELEGLTASEVLQIVVDREISKGRVARNGRLLADVREAMIRLEESTFRICTFGAGC